MLLLFTTLAVLSVHAESGVSTQVTEASLKLTSFQSCRRSRLSQFKVKECKTALKTISHDEFLPHDTTCFITCADTNWNGHGWRRCENGVWTGSPIHCKGKILSRVKRKQVCHGWWLDKRCADVKRGGTFRCRYHWGKTCTVTYEQLRIICPHVKSPQMIPYPDRRYINKTFGTPKVYGGGGQRIITPPFISRRYDIGTHTERFTVKDERGRSASCSFSFTVTAYECPLPRVSGHLRVHCGDDNPVIFGTTCRYSCDPGYVLVGSSTTECQKNGTYSRSKPYCERKKCGAFTKRLKNGYFTCSITPRFGDICSPTCFDSFKISGVGLLTCNASGLWSDFNIFCKDVKKPTITCPPNTIISLDKNSNSTTLSWVDAIAEDNSDDFNVSQTRGPAKGSRQGKGSYLISYKVEDGEGFTDTCTFRVTVEAVECEFPPDVEDKFILYNCEGNMYGNKCNLSCRNNYKLKGDTSITCNKKQSAVTETFWGFYNQPNCDINDRKLVVCGNPPAPKNGAVACDRWVGGSICSILCNDGYDTPRGLHTTDSDYHCSIITGKWSPSTTPQCTVSRTANYSIPGRINLYFSGDCEEKKDVIAQKFYDKLVANGALNKAKCRPYKDCRADNVKVTCGDKVSTGRRKRETKTTVEISWDITATFQRNNETIHESLDLIENRLRAMFKEVEKDIDSGEFDDLEPGLEVVNSTISVEIGRLVCAEGLEPSYKTGTCRACPLGTVYNKTRNGCDMCPRGTYKDENVALAVCKPCGIGNTTLEQASTHPDNCTEMCNPGQYSRTGTIPCKSCVQGTYQPKNNSTSCLTCPPGTTTPASGFQSLEDCSDFDLVMKGNQWIKTNELVTSSITNKYTILTSLKVANISAAFFLQFNVSNTNVFNMTFNNFTLIVNRIQNASLARHDDWFYLVFNVDGSTMHIQQYSYSSLISNQTITVSNLQMKNNSVIGFTTIDDHVLVIRSLKVMPRILTDKEILEQVGTCGTPPTLPTPILSFDDLSKVEMSDVEIILGSSCDVYDDCLSSPCNNHTCVNKVGGFQCECSDGFTGTNCENPPDYCSLDSCLNNATCVNSPQTKNFTCLCPQGFKGVVCNIEIVNGGWTEWTNWTECSATCNGGIKTRERSCTNPIPEADGLNCTGEAREIKSCSIDPCPVCLKEDLKLGAGVEKVECTGDKYDMICTPICKTGLVFKSVIPSYECRGNDWLSGNKTEPCTEPVVPSEYKAGVTLNYQLPDCNSTEAITKTVENKTSHLPCSSNPNCTLKVKVKDCVVVNKRNVLTVDVSVKIPINTTAVKMSIGIENGTDDVTRALTTLEEAGKMISDDSTFFDLQVDGVNYKSTRNMSAGMSCEPGSVPTDTICVKCSPGEYYNPENNKCIYCEKNTYQPKDGQTSCLPCPENERTFYIGSDSREDCMKLEFQGEETRTDDNLLIYILVPVGILILTAIIVISILLIRKKRKIDSRKVIKPM